MPRKKAIIKAALFAILVFGILWLRRPDSLLNAQFWAEDGGVFFREQVLFGFWGALTRTYAGYIHAIPRVIAAVMCMLPVRWVPLAFNLTTLCIEAICCSAFFWPSYRRVIESDLLRATCCILAAASVVAGSELIATVSNIQWFLCVLSLLLIVTTGKEIWLTAVQVGIALSAPVTLLYALFLLWQIKSNSLRLKIRPVVHLIALAVQAWVIRHNPTGHKPVLRFNSLFLATLSGGLSRCVLAPMLGADFSRRYSVVALFTAMALALIAVVALATIFAIRCQRRWPLGAAYVGVGSLAAILWGRGLMLDFLTMDGLRTYTAERYFFVGSCMFIFCVAKAVDLLPLARQPVRAALLLAAPFVYGTIQNFSCQPFLDLNWKENAVKIEQWEAARQRHEKVEPLKIPMNPNLNLVLD